MPRFYQKAEVKNYGTVTITASSQKQTEVQIPANSDISHIEVDLATNLTLGTGAVGTGITVADTINALEIKDKTSGKIHDLLGKDLPRLQVVMHPRGKQATNATLATGAQTYRAVISMPIGLKDQPARLTLTLEAIGVLLSTVGTATMTATVIITAYYKPAVQGSKTLRTHIFNSNGVVGDNDLSEFLPKGKKVVKTFIFVALDANLTDITMRSSQTEEFNKIKTQSWVNEDAYLLDAGHIAGLFIIRHSEYTVTQGTKLVVNEGTATSGVNFRNALVIED